MNVTDVLARVMQLQAQAAVTGTAGARSSGAEFAAVLQSAAGGFATQPSGPGSLVPSSSPGAVLGSLLPANLRAAVVAEPVQQPVQQPSAGDGVAAPAGRSCRCESH